MDSVKGIILKEVRAPAEMTAGDMSITYRGIPLEEDAVLEKQQGIDKANAIVVELAGAIKNIIFAGFTSL